MQVSHPYLVTLKQLLIPMKSLVELKVHSFTTQTLYFTTIIVVVRFIQRGAINRKYSE
jgi:hypothetical protein